MALGSAIIGALRVNLGIDTAQYNKGLSQAEKMGERFGASIGRTLRNVAALAIAVAGPAAIGLLVKSSMAAIDTQSKLATRLGATVAGVQALQHAADLAGVPIESISRNLGIMNARLGEAERTGIGPVKEALDRLGFSARELSEMDIDERIAALADRMKELGYTTQQQADFLRQMGIRSQEMINLFQEGSGAIRASRADLEAWGVALSNVDARKVEAANDAITRIGTVFEGIGNQMAVALAPILEHIAGLFTDAAKETGGFKDAIGTAVRVGVLAFGSLISEVQRFRIELDEAIAGVLNLWDALAGAPAAVADWLTFGGATRLFPFEPINKEFGKLRETLGEPPTMEEWDQWWTDLQAKAEAAAAVASGPAGGGDDDEETEADRKAAEKLAAQLATRLETLRMSLLTEREAELQSYAQRSIDLEDFYRRGMVSTEEYHEMVAAAERDHLTKMADMARAAADLRQREMDGMLGNVAGTLGAISSIFATESDKQFTIAKAAGIAQALISTYQGIAAGLKLGWPMSIPAVAYAAATGISQIAALRATTKTGGGTPSGGTAPAAAPAAAPSQTLFISGINSDQLYSGDAMRGLFEKINAHIKDGGRLVLA